MMLFFILNFIFSKYKSKYDVIIDEISGAGKDLNTMVFPVTNMQSVVCVDADEVHQRELAWSGARLTPGVLQLPG